MRHGTNSTYKIEYQRKTSKAEANVYCHEGHDRTKPHPGLDKIISEGRCIQNSTKNAAGSPKLY